MFFSDSKREQERLIAQQKKADKDLKKTLEVSKREAELLQKDRHTLDEVIVVIVSPKPTMNSFFKFKNKENVMSLILQ